MATSTSSAALYGEGYEPRRPRPQDVRAVRFGRSLLGFRITEVAGCLDWVVT
jgi:hypothetical protein